MLRRLAQKTGTSGEYRPLDQQEDLLREDTPTLRPTSRFRAHDEGDDSDSHTSGPRRHSSTAY